MNAIFGAGVLASSALYVYSRYIEPRKPVLETVSIPVGPGEQSFAGLRIGFMSDIHAGPFFDLASFRLACQLIADCSPDLMLFGGDFVSESPRYMETVMPELRQLAANSSLGGIAVLGNHDHFVSAQTVTTLLESSDIPVLRNDAVEVIWDGKPLWVVGIDDSLHGMPDVTRAYQDVPSDESSIVVWHEAAFAQQTVPYQPLVQLSGHSHGGQVRLPGVRPMWVPKHSGPHVAGLSIVDGMPLYTSRGLGVYRPPIRFRCSPEVTLITFRSISE